METGQSIRLSAPLITDEGWENRTTLTLPTWDARMLQYLSKYLRKSKATLLRAAWRQFACQWYGKLAELEAKAQKRAARRAKVEANRKLRAERRPGEPDPTEVNGRGETHRGRCPECSAAYTSRELADAGHCASCGHVARDHDVRACRCLEVKTGRRKRRCDPCVRTVLARARRTSNVEAAEYFDLRMSQVWQWRRRDDEQRATRGKSADDAREPGDTGGRAPLGAGDGGWERADR